MLQRLVACLVIIGAVLGIYYAALPAYFFEDDFQWLVTRWSFQPSDLFDLSSRGHFYRPVIELYFWIASPLFDGSPRAFHTANILLHVANGGLVFLVASALGMRQTFAFVTSLLFVVQPGYVAAIAWVGALAEAVGAFFGCASVYALLRSRQTGHSGWRLLALASFSMALLTHESSVVFLPILVLSDWTAGRISWKWRDLVRMYLPFVGVTAVYLVVDLTVNSRHYVVSEGQYRIGFHMVRNIFEYIASLYVGERTLFWHVVVAAVLAWVLARGTARARLGVAWMVLAILPFAPFNTANVSRYQYLPAVGVAVILAEGLAALDDWLARRAVAARRAIVVILVAATAIRFGVFAHDGVRDFAARAETYRHFLVALRQERPQIADGMVLTIDAEIDKTMPLRFLEAAVQWEYRNPTIRLVVAERLPER